jgi:hypothetical protein
MKYNAPEATQDAIIGNNKLGKELGDALYAYLDSNYVIGDKNQAWQVGRVITIFLLAGKPITPSSREIKAIEDAGHVMYEREDYQDIILFVLDFYKNKGLRFAVDTEVDRTMTIKEAKNIIKKAGYKLQEGPGSGVDIYLFNPRLGERRDKEVKVYADNIVLENYYDGVDYNENYGVKGEEIEIGVLDVSKCPLAQFKFDTTKDVYEFMVGGGYTHSEKIPQGCEVEIIAGNEDEDLDYEGEGFKVPIYFKNEYIEYLWEDLWNPQSDEDEEEF